jgi:hypothetical protein
VTLGRSWVTNFIPEGEFVARTSSDSEIFLVVKVLPGACLLWTARRPWTPQLHCCLVLHATELKFIPLLSLDEWCVLSYSPLSPLERHLLGVGSGHGMVFSMTGAPKLVMEWQAERAFAGVPESSLKQMVAEKDAEMADLGETSECSYSDHLALKLMLLYRPELSADEAQSALLRRNIEQDVDGSGYLDDVGDEHWNDVVLIGDQKDGKEIVGQHKKARERRVRAIASTKKLVEVVFPKAKELMKKASTKAQAKTIALQEKQNRERVYAALAADVNKAVLENVPDKCKVVTDVVNGRLLLSYPGFKTRSVSWTRRGSENAGWRALGIAWGWHEAATGTPVPSHFAFEGAETGAD